MSVNLQFPLPKLITRNLSLQVGVTVETGSNPKILANRIKDEQFGAIVHSGACGVVEGNEVFGDCHAGISVQPDADVSVRNNLIHPSSGVPLYIAGENRGQYFDQGIAGKMLGMEHLPEKLALTNYQAGWTTPASKPEQGAIGTGISRELWDTPLRQANDSPPPAVAL